MAADRADGRAAVFDQLQHGLLERAVHYVGPRGGPAGDDPGLWPGARVDIFARRADHASKRSLPSCSAIVGVAVIFIDQLRVENWMAFAGCVGDRRRCVCRRASVDPGKGKGGGHASGGASSFAK